MNSIRILEGDSLSVLRTLPDDSVQVCVTSPPYWGLRDYGTAKWEGGDPSCEHKGKSKPRQDTTGSGVGHGRFSDSRGLQPGKAAYVVPVRGSCVCGAIRVDAQIGLEKTPEEYIAKLVTVFDEVRRVLRKDGTLWLNIGDCYATGAGAVGDQPGGGKQGARWRGDVDRVRDTKRAYRKGSNRAQRGDGNSGQPFGPMTQPNRMPIQGLKPKDLVGVPWMLAFALRAAGWWLRSDIIWHKPNPMPESTKDRPTKAHEYIFLLTKSQRYYYDAAAITEASSENTNPRRAGNQKWPAGWGQGEESRNTVEFSATVGRSAASSKKRKLAATGSGTKNNASFDEAMAVMPGIRNKRSVWTVAMSPFPDAHFATFPPKLIEPCILAGSPLGGVVLDPFSGAGTTGLMCSRLGRDYVGIELNPAYAAMSRRRIADDAPLFEEGIA
jgi:DNA modification methylase